LLWKYNTLGKINGSPVISGASVVIASGDGRIYVLDLQTGKQTWMYEMGSPSSSTPAIIQDLLVIASEDGRVFAFSLKGK